MVLTDDPKIKKLTREEYLKAEYKSETRHEFINGEVRAMAGASFPHVFISDNIKNSIKERVDAKSSPIACRAFASGDLRVHSPKTDTYFYPDILIACPPYQLNNDKPQALLNPKAIIEILSPSTYGYDLSRKLAAYKMIESLEEVLFVDSTDVWARRYYRQGGAWSPEADIFNLNDLLQLATLAIEIPLERIYTGIDFADSADLS